MTQSINSAYRAAITSQGLNDKIFNLAGTNGVVKGYNVVSGTGKTLSLTMSPDTSNVLIIKGAHITESADLLNTLTVTDNATGSVRYDTVYAKYANGTDASCTYGILANTLVVPDATYCKLATLAVPNGFTASSQITITNVTEIKNIVQNQIEPAAQVIRDSVPSGFISISDLDYTYMGANPNTIKFLTEQIAYVNGYRIVIPAGTIVTANAGPSDVPRDDLFFLEVWLDKDTGLPQWRIREVDGVDFATVYSYGGDNGTVVGWSSTSIYTKVTPQGGNVSPVSVNTSSFQTTIFKAATYYAAFWTTIFNDYGLWLAGDGTSTAKTVLNTFDGYVYAIPMFKVHRRPSCGYMESGEYDKISPLSSVPLTKPRTDKTKLNHTGITGGVTGTISGRTLVNLIPDTESVYNFWVLGQSSVNTTLKLFGLSSRNLTASGTNLTNIYDMSVLDSTHKYFLSGYSYISSYTSGAIVLAYCDYNGWTNATNVSFDTTKLNQWQRKSIIFTNRSSVRIYPGIVTTPIATANFDGIMLYDLTQIYGAGNEPSDISLLERQLPYVSGVKSVGGVSVKSSGKNLFNPNILKNCPIAKINGDNSITLNGTLSGHYFFSIYLGIGTYKGSSDLANIHLFGQDVNGNQNDEMFNGTHYVYNPDTITGYIPSGTYNNVTTSLQLEVGSSASSYEAYSESSFVTPMDIVDLKSIGNAKDTLNIQTGDWTKNVSDWMTLDGSKTYVGITNKKGFKEVRTDLSATAISGLEMVIKNTGTILAHSSSMIAESSASSSTSVYIRISNNDTGFIDNYTPSSAEVSAYFYGWKMCNSDGSTWDGVSTKYWKRITDGTGITSTLPTSSYAGYTPYKMIYQLATPVVTNIKDKMEGRMYLNSGYNGITVDNVNSVVGGQIAVPNLVTNGDFSNGTTRWIANNGTAITASNNILTCTVTAIDMSVGVYEFIGTVDVSHKYYFSFIITPKYANIVNFGFDSAPVSKTPVAGIPNMLSTITSPIATSTKPIIFYHDCRTNYAINDTFTIQKCFLIDLTATFGAGNEPSQAWCDKYLAFGTNYAMYSPSLTTALRITGNNGDKFSGVQGNVGIIPANKYDSTKEYKLYYRDLDGNYVYPDVSLACGTGNLSLTNNSNVGSVTLVDSDLSYKKSGDGAKLYQSLTVNFNTALSRNPLLYEQVTVTLTSTDYAKLTVGNSIYNSSAVRVAEVKTLGSSYAVTFVMYAGGQGNGTYYVGDRVDVLRSDIVDKKDLVDNNGDLRRKVTLTGFDYDNLLTENWDRLYRNEL